MPNYVLSPQAQNSLKQISRYTTENFGEQQKRKYIKLLREKMRGAANSPYKGQKRSEIKEGYHSIRAGRHHIYYRIQETHIEIIDVLHQSMEPGLHI